MSSVTEAPATLADLALVGGKAELIAGRIVHLIPTGYRPNRVAGRIYRSLAEHVDATGRGVAFTDNMGFAVPELPSGRQTFSPDVAFYLGTPPSDEMDFVAGAPTFAVEVRSKGDYGDAAEAALAAKRADYFQSGTPLVWDVDSRAQCVRAYRAGDPSQAVTYRKGQQADAEPVVPGWRMSVDDLFA